ncbi:hypothetical protein Tco_1035577 [Tanacetum coccineum]
MSYLTSIYSIGNIMEEVDIEDLTIEQYFRLTQESQIPKKVDDMTIAEYLEYEKTIKTQDYDEYQPYSAKADVSTKYRDNLSPRHKNHAPPLDTETNPYLQASQSPVHPKIAKTSSKYTREIKEQSNKGLVDIVNINAIANLGASVNIMSKSMFDELSLADPKYANIIVEMDDKTRYGYSKNHKKTVKAGQTRTRERKECTKAGDLIARKDKSQLKVNS